MGGRGEECALALATGRRRFVGNGATFANSAASGWSGFNLMASMSELHEAHDAERKSAAQERMNEQDALMKMAEFAQQVAMQTGLAPARGRIRTRERSRTPARGAQARRRTPERSRRPARGRSRTPARGRRQTVTSPPRHSASDAGRDRSADSSSSSSPSSHVGRRRSPDAGRGLRGGGRASPEPNARQIVLKAARPKLPPPPPRPTDGGP